MALPRLAVIALLVSLAVAFPSMSEDGVDVVTPVAPLSHNGMATGMATPAGSDAVHGRIDTMSGVTDCDGEPGAVSRDVQVWPSPAPLPSASPAPKAMLTGNRTNATAPQPPSPPERIAPSCADDELFVDSKGLRCRDYIMNKELCKVADRYVNRKGKTARHACCKCGGGTHVIPAVEKRCERPGMGGEDGCTEEKYATLENSNNTEGFEMGIVGSVADPLPESRTSISVGDSIEFDEVAMEDEVEDDAVDQLGTVGSMNSVLEPDSVVFRDRNFVGFPQEPDTPRMVGSGDFTVNGKLRLVKSVNATVNASSASPASRMAQVLIDDTMLGAEWATTHAPTLMSALARASNVAASSVTLPSITHTSATVTEVEFTITPEVGSDFQTAQGLASVLNSALSSGIVVKDMLTHSFPKCTLIVLVAPTPVELDVPVEVSLSTVSTHKQYTTVPYTVGHKETMTSIADKFHVTPALLVSFNQDIADPWMVKEGDIVFAPVPRLLKIDSVSPSNSALEGGTDIVVRGSGFVYPTYCKFGDVISRATYVVDNTVVCPSPGQREPGTYSLSVSDGKGGFMQSPMQVDYTVGLIPFCDEPGARPSWCRPRLAIFGVTPLRWPQDVPTQIQVTGVGFNASTVCTLDSMAVPTHVISRTNLTCELTARGPSVNSVVLHQGTQTASTQLEVVVYSTLSITSISPSHGPESGTNNVTVYGTTFKPGCLCRFDTLMVPAVYISSTEVICTAPASTARIAALDISNNGFVFTPKSAEYEYTYLQLTSMSMTAGHVVGGDEVTLTGYGFYPGMWCRFGPNRTLANVINVSTAVCVTPRMAEAKRVPVSVSLDGLRSWTEDEIMFQFFAGVTEVRPNTGRASGGDNVLVLGEGFDQFCAYTCRFGVRVVPAVVISSTQVQCTSPPGTGLVDFVLESRDNTYKTNVVGRWLDFTYVGAQDTDLFAVFPAHTEVRTANTSVVMKGTGFTPGTMCRFGDKMSLATVIDSNTLKCAAPMRDLAELVPVSISHDGGKTWSGTLTYFEYRAVVQDVAPPMGFMRGGEKIHVKGYGFNYRMQLCVFGNEVVYANVTNQYEAICIAPESVAPAKVPFAMTCNTSTMYDPYLEFDFSYPQADRWGTFYLYSANPSLFITSIVPPTASSVGGAPIMVHGEGFDRTSHCMFGESSVKASFLDAATIRCIAPPHMPGIVPFKVVTFNKTMGYNETELDGGFTFGAPTVQTVVPDYGFVTGGETITVTGQFLGGAQTCNFGTSKVPALTLDESSIQCVTPRIPVSSTMTLEVGFGTGGNALSNVAFSFHPVITRLSPEHGYILSENQILVFHGIGFNGDPVQCVFEEQTFVPATIRSDTELACAVPVQSSPHAADVRLTNQRHQVLGGQVFKYRYNYAVQDIHPNVGSTTGGSTIVAVGSGLSSVTHCGFGEDKVRAVVISDLMVRCTSPYHMPGLVHFTLMSETSSPDAAFVSNPVEFTYRILNTHVDSIHPSSGASGGGTLVTIRGSGFSMGSFCKFGDIEVPVVYYATDHVACYSPVIVGGESRTVAVEVSQLGGNEGFSVDGHTFTFHTNVSTVSRVDPAWANEGDTVTVTGSNFDATSVCYFGGRPSPSTNFVSDLSLECEVPAMGTKVQEVVQVTSDPAHLPGGHVVFHYERPLSTADSVAVREIVPALGPTAGGTTVAVHGVNFPDPALCRFGDLFVPATFMSSTLVHCSAPQHRAATVVVEVVSEDRQSFSSSFIRYTYQATSESAEDDLQDSSASGVAEIERVEPSSGYAGDDVTLVGQRFSSVGFCVFSDSSTTLQVRAVVADSTHVTCEVPARVGDMSANVSIKYLAVTGTESHGVSFRYLSG